MSDSAKKKKNSAYNTYIFRYETCLIPRHKSAIHFDKGKHTTEPHKIMLNEIERDINPNISFQLENIFKSH